MRSMYSGVSSPTHHIFFAPRLEVVVTKRDANRLSADVVDESAGHCLAGDEADGSATLSFVDSEGGALFDLVVELGPADALWLRTVSYVEPQSSIARSFVLVAVYEYQMSMSPLPLW